MDNARNATQLTLAREAGMRSAFVTSWHGQICLYIDVLQDLLVTEGFKVVKIGVFATDDIRKDGTLMSRSSTASTTSPSSS